MKITGYKEVNYISKKTGEEVRGYKFYGTYPSNNVVGEATGEEYLSEYIIQKHGGIIPGIGDELNVSFNRFGKIDHYEVV